jgi:hypothetical protein
MMRLYQVRKVSYDETVPVRKVSYDETVPVRKVSYDVFVLVVSILPIFAIFILNLELFRLCGIFVCFSFYIFILISCTFYVVIANIMMYFKNS